MTRTVVACSLLAALVVTAQAAVVCQKKSGAMFIRATCKKHETQVNLADLGTAPPSGTAGGDLTGTYPNPLVTALQSYPVSAAPPQSGQTLTWNGSEWGPTAPVAFDVLSLIFQTLPHDQSTTLDFNYNNTAGAFDDGGYFSLADDWFTPPVSGYYFLDAFVSLDTRSSPPSNFYIYFAVNGSSSIYRRYYTMVSGGYTQLDFPIVVKLNAGDHVSVVCNPKTNDTSTMGGNSYGVVRFSGFKIN